MKRQRRLVLILVLVAAVVVTAAGVAIAFAADRSSAQAGETAPAATPAPVVRPDRAIVVKGAVVPAQRATLSMAASGIVSETLVREGDPVEAGQVILRLQDARQRAAVAEADAALATAQARLEALRTGPRDQEMAAAQAVLDAANARLARLQEGARPNDVAAAEAALDAARATQKRLYDGPEVNVRIAAETDVANAQAALRSAQAAYDQVQGQPNAGMLSQSLQLEQVTNAYTAAKARYDALFTPPTAERVAQAAAQVKQAQANLDRLQQPATAAEIAEAAAMARQAQAQLELLKAGATAQEVAAAEAAVAQAQAGRQQALASLADTELTAPFAGTVARLHVRQGEQVGGGLPVAEIGALAAWQVETDDLSELDVVRVQPGQAVGLTFDAIPGLQLNGTVERLQQKGEKKLGDMTYTAVIRVADADARLMWNMTAVVALP
jgi:multidrug resistance efflux pump